MYYLFIYLQCDPKVVQLLGDLRAELRLAANARPGGQLDPHLPILNPPLLGSCYEIILYPISRVIIAEFAFFCRYERAARTG